jgi:hypothetical protein
VRNIPIFVLVAVPILGEHLSAWWPARPVAGPGAAGALDPAPPSSERVTVAIVLGLALGALLIIPLPATGSPLVRTTLLPHRFPIAATEYIRAHPGQFRGNLLNAYGWGGYLLLELPEHPVFVDGRNDFYGDAFMAEFAAVDKVQPNWRAVLDRYAVGWTLLAPAHPLHAVLALSAGWERVYADDTAQIWVRR